MKNYLLFSLILWANFAFSQLNESFNDGNLTSNPGWSGSNAANDFTVITEQLRSNSGTANSNFYLSTPNALGNNCKWEFWVNLQFNPSGANYVDVYLSSDQANLQSTNINGYFVRLGNTNDEICLFKRLGAASSNLKLIDGADGILNTSNNKIKVRITRTADNLFTLERDITGLGTSYVTEGTFQDASFTTSAYFGIFIQQSTSGFFQKHFFDDFKINALITDNTPPALVSATVIDSTSIEVLFSEAVDSLSAKTITNYTLSNGFGNPVLIKTSADLSKFILKLSKGLNTGSYILTATNIADKAGNLVSSGNTATFSYIKPFIAIKGDIVINEIFADPSPQIDLPSVEFIELYNTTNHSISLKNWKYSDAASSASLSTDSIKSGQYLILCAKADTNEFKQFGKTIGVSPWPSLNNSSDIIKLISPENKTIDSVSYSDTWHENPNKKQGGWSLERINYSSLCGGLFNWTASKDAAGGTPGKQNAVFIPDYDQLNFKADSIKRLSDSSINVYMNKPAEVTTATDAFSLQPSSGLIKSVTFDASARQATVVFSTAFSPATSYEFNVSRLKDCAGNTLHTRLFSFDTPKLPPVRQDTAKIFITEILADPSPEIKLPLAEFVELVNPGKDTIDLDGWTFNNSRTKTTLKNASILPNEYVILCPAADTVHYKAFGKTIGLSPWPTLTNTADQVTLKSFKGRLSDSVAYSDTWYPTTLKKQGGWSLERINYLSICSGIFNWTASNDASGGTPGKPNSTFIPNYDQLGFKADSMKRASDSTLQIFFNKPADLSLPVAGFELSPGNVQINSTILDPNSRSAILTFNKRFQAGTSYQLTITQIKDCAGNTIIPRSFSFSTAAPPPVKQDTASVFITEIFADPSPEVKLPLAEFVEIFNPGKDTADLEGWTLSAGISKSTFKAAKILPRGYLILCPVADTLNYQPYGRVAGLTPWPGLTNSSGKLILKSFKGRPIDSVAYSDTWHSSPEKKQGGWSIERIDYKSVCSGNYNWKSSVDNSGGTPGTKNSIHIPDYDKLPFNADSVKQASDSSFTIYFNKYTDASTSINAFKLTPAFPEILSASFDSWGTKCTVALKGNFTPNTTYQITISDLRDCSGKIISANNDLTFTTPKPLPVRQDTARLYLTEILADPSPEIKLPLVEFIEIYNPGKDTIDLDGWILANSKTSSTIKKASILPKDFLILCSAADTSQYKTFGKVAGLSLWPSLNNSTDQIYLKSFKGRLVDSISYRDSWHNATKKQGGWSLERIDYLSACRGAYNWVSSADLSGGTPGKQNSAAINNFDKIPLRADSIKQLSDTSISVYFNKFTDVSTGSFSTIPSAGGIESTVFDTRGTMATISFNNKFAANTTYKLVISNLKDCAGNSIINSELSFTTPKLPPLRTDTARIVITEIFADPSPEIKLPLVEFIELYNPGKDTIDLDGWSLSNSRTKGILKKCIILPGNYLIICNSGDTSNYDPYGKVAGISPWPALTNASDRSVLKSFNGRLVDSVYFDDTWYKSREKQGGGWSLELMDYRSACTGTQNWTASTDASGGTPGRQNSVHQLYKSTPLKITNANLIDSCTIILKFNKPPENISARTPGNYLLNNGIGSPSEVRFNTPALDEAELKFISISRGKNYRISCSDITDCSGASISPAENYAEFFYPDKIAKNDILINEVLFNPRAGGTDFVEIYNNSNKLLDLKELALASTKVPDSVINISPLAVSTRLFKPGDYLVLTKDPEVVKSNYRAENPEAFLKMNSMPSYSNEAGVVLLISGQTKIDQLNYSEKMHFALIKDPKGVSLERTSFSNPANEAGNFRSAAAIAGFATPGYKNSQFVEEMSQQSNEIELLSKTFSPDNDGFEDALFINYHFKDAGKVANVSIYSDKGVLIKKLAKNITLAAEGTLVWDGMKDDEQRAAIGIYIVYFEIFNLKGQTKKYKKACVLASKLR
ncbi:MAG: lamin tail domain-containing protein [Sphingobacteriaceae bacterium]|nr:lamin tail domain-containing protein [Sphingobacteriaceae bacterium]